MRSQDLPRQVSWCGAFVVAFATYSTLYMGQPSAPSDVFAAAAVQPVKRAVEDGRERKAVERLLRISDDNRAIVELFRLGSDVVPDLVRSLRVRAVRARAAKAIAYSGEAAGLKALLDTARSERDVSMRIELSSYLAGSLVQARKGEHLKFLRDCIAQYRDDEADVVAAAAALTLGTMRTADAAQILRVARDLDAENLAHHEIAKAQRWINSGRAVIGYPRAGQIVAGEDGLREFVLSRAFYAEAEESGLAVETVIWNKRHDKALVEVAVYERSALAREYHVVVAPVSGKAGEFLITGIWLNLVA
jgi:hypothetical protein